MKSRLSRTFIILISLLLTVTVAAQTRQNSLAINGSLADDAGPYYFSGSDTAFARAVPLARALGLNVSWNAGDRTLRFEASGRSGVVPTTTDVASGLSSRANAYSVGGTAVTSPLGIVVDGTSYVAVQPLAEAFGFITAWHAGPRLLMVDSPAPEPEPVAEAPAAVVTSSGARLNAFRVGPHDGFTRVAVDLGPVETFRTYVGDRVFAVIFDAGGMPDTAFRVLDDNIRSAYYTVLDGKPALVINTHHPVSESRGFRTGMTDSGTFYVDVGPGMSSSTAVAALPAALAAAAAGAVPMPGTDSTAAAPAPGGSAAQHQWVVVLDPGHGGVDPGAVGYVQEHAVVLAVAQRVRALLEAQGVQVILTREANNHLSPEKVRDLQMRADHATPDRNMFVSIHANSFGQASANGVETWVFGQPLSQANLDRAITENGGQALTDVALEIANDPAVMILRETQLNYSRRLAEAVQQGMISNTGAVDRGVKQSAFYVIRNARTPSILVEIGFVSNPVEGPNLGSAAYQDRLARGIAGGIIEFLSSGDALARQ